MSIFSFLTVDIKKEPLQTHSRSYNLNIHLKIPPIKVIKPIIKKTGMIISSIEVTLKIESSNAITPPIKIATKHPNSCFPSPFFHLYNFIFSTSIGVISFFLYLLYHLQGVFPSRKFRHKQCFYTTLPSSYTFRTFPKAYLELTSFHTRSA